jgi:hypothetical protein
MYWPHGVPRVYAVNGPDIAYVPSDEDRETLNTTPTNDRNTFDEDAAARGDDGQHESADTKPHESQTNPSSDTGKSGWGSEAIRDICVSRSGQMFATMSETSIALWQTRVCRQ